MRFLRVALREVLGLFVDDGAFALAIVAWCVAAGVVLPRLGLGAEWGGMVLLLGLAAILVESAWRRARGRS